jgi:hypothetical protein
MRLMPTPEIVKLTASKRSREILMRLQAEPGTPQTIVNSSVGRTREYLTGAEVDRLMATGRKTSRYGHHDATMILLAVRAVAHVAGGVERGVHHPEWDARSAYPVCCAAHASDRRPAQSDAIAGHRPRKPAVRAGMVQGRP